MDESVWKNLNFVGFCFRRSERLVFYIKRRKRFVDDLFSRSMTWEYRGLPGVTRGYKELQGVTRGDRGDEGLQKIIETFS